MGMSPFSSDMAKTRFSFRITRSSSIWLILLVAHPIVAIVGRPNVGKSTLFNRLNGWRKAIVDPTAGLTRDRLYGVVEWRGRAFSVGDTAGLELDGPQAEGWAAIGAPAR